MRYILHDLVSQTAAKLLSVKVGGQKTRLKILLQLAIVKLQLVNSILLRYGPIFIVMASFTFGSCALIVSDVTSIPN